MTPNSESPKTGRVSSFVDRLAQWRGHVTVFYHPAYRLPLADVEHARSIEPRRADFAVWALREHRALRSQDIRTPPLATYEQLQLVHSPQYLESLSSKETLAQIFALDSSEVPVDELLRTVRLACGGTVQAAQEALKANRPVLNTLGGFHHAAPSHGGGFCAINDIAVAVATLRREGFTGEIVVLDLDAHPPDGTVECLRTDARVWMGSLSGSNWGEIQGLHARLSCEHCGDAEYLKALDGLLSGMPRPDLAFIVAGGDVLSGDRFGLLRLTLDGARRRDARVLRALRGKASVWLPGGGYHPDAWRVLAGTGFVLAGRARTHIQRGFDPLSAQFRKIGRSLRTQSLGMDLELTDQDIDETLAKRTRQGTALFGLYSKEGIEYALFRYGVTPHIQRLGYINLRVELDTQDEAGRVRLFGKANGQDYLLLEAVLEQRHLGAQGVLFVNWLVLRHPIAKFSPNRPRLPGQDAPGLGLAREIGEMLAIMAGRLGLDGVAFRPSWYHTAYAARYRGRFVDPKRQGRFEALVRDLAGIPLLDATRAVAEGRVKLNGKPYQWEAEDMVAWLKRAPLDDEAQIAGERENSHFALDSTSTPPAS